MQTSCRATNNSIIHISRISNERINHASKSKFDPTHELITPTLSARIIVRAYFFPHHSTTFTKNAHFSALFESRGAFWAKRASNIRKARRVRCIFVFLRRPLAKTSYVFAHAPCCTHASAIRYVDRIATSAQSIFRLKEKADTPIGRRRRFESG